jgi:ribosomal protein S18 acetylase RimI-like enzyme
VPAAAPEPTTRPATPDDVDALRAVARAAYRHYVERMDRPPAPLLADYAALVADGVVRVAELDGRVAGLLVLLDRADHLLLDNIAVHPAAQGRGVGVLLLRLAETEATRRGHPEIRLYTNEAMTENLAYYPRHGYTETHRAVTDGYRRVHFRKPAR